MHNHSVFKDINNHIDFLKKKHQSELVIINNYFNINNINKNYFILTKKIITYLISERFTGFISCESKCNCDKLHKNLFELYFDNNKFIPICCVVSINNPINNHVLIEYINNEVILLGDWICNL